MNEQIKQLAVQAGITTNIDTDYFEKDANKWVEYFAEKFAELIVRETLDQVNANMELIWPEIEVKIKEYFGLEE